MQRRGPPPDHVIADKHGKHEYRQLEHEGRAGMRALLRHQGELLRQLVELPRELAGIAGKLAGALRERCGIRHAFSLSWWRPPPPPPGPACPPTPPASKPP